MTNGLTFIQMKIVLGTDCLSKYFVIHRLNFFLKAKATSQGSGLRGQLSEEYDNKDTRRYIMYPKSNRDYCVLYLWYLHKLNLLFFDSTTYCTHSKAIIETLNPPD